MFARAEIYRPGMLSRPTLTFSRPAVPAWMRRLAATKVAMMMGHLVMAFREARQMQRALRKTHPFSVDH
jgi:hypothetical protein